MQHHEPAPRGLLRHKLAENTCLLVPGVYDMFSARLASAMQFDALYLTGYGVSASHLGLPDVGLMGYSDMVERARTVAQSSTHALIADADTGFGNILNVQHTVRGYEAAGVQAIQIEDQESPKKCGHTPGKRVIPTHEMVRKIEVAVAARRSDDTLIIARTDARAQLGLEQAIQRAKEYARAGADILFVEAPHNIEEFKKIAQEVPGYKLANIVPTGLSPEVSQQDLQAWGYNIALFPALCMTAACQAIQHSLSYLQQHGQTVGLTPAPMSMEHLHQLVGFEAVWAFEKQFIDI